ncbi:heat shock protein beta-7-like [Centropristis striata]|uniref:heat shock protein beta-7-like n=1 Tax=Centropristis striata TaxID=184440 RepID=UPI0027E0D6BD|nr:heat shock protein beta-7-like [Centropristis striata]
MEKGQGFLSEEPGSGPPQTCRDKFAGHSFPTGKIQVMGDIFQFTVDVSEFSPEDVIITSSNNLIKVHAEKMAEDGSVTNTFCHQCKLPTSVDPLSLSMKMESGGVLTVRAHRLSLF